MKLEKLPLAEKFEREYEIIEESCTPPYKVKIRLQAQSINGVFIDVPKMKSQAHYLSKQYFPKDCDAIVVDLDVKKVYLIELKNSTNTSPSWEIAEQLKAGGKWWDHIAFCTDIPEDERYEVVKVAMIANPMKSSRRRIEKNEYGFYKIAGSSLKFDFLK